MNRSDYSFAVFILVLSVISGLLLTTIYLLLGNQMFFQDFFIAFFILVNVISLTGTAILSKYFHHKGYTSAFLGLLLSALATLIQVSLLYMMIVERKLEGYYFDAVTFLLFTSILFGGILVFSKSSERKWLKIAGILAMLTSGALLAISYWGISTQDIHILSNLEKTSRWTSLVTTLIPIFFILNFQEELKTNLTSSSKAVDSRYTILKFLFLVAFLGFGLPYARDGYMFNYWQQKNQESVDQMEELFDHKTFVGSNGDSLQFLLLQPTVLDSSKAYPLVVSLPYNGYHASAALELSENVNRLKYLTYIMVPFCPEGEGWGGVPNIPVMDQLVFEALESLGKTEKIDPDRRYITGVSRGGYGTWHFITARPDLFAAAIPVCGEGDTTLASKITDVAVWAFHGEKDKNVPVSGSRDMIAAIKAAGGNPKYSEYENEGHNIWDKVITEPELWPWLFSQKKE